MSATWTTVGGVLAQNAAALLSTSELFMGKSAQKLTMEQWLGLALSAVAVWAHPACPSPIVALGKATCHYLLARRHFAFGTRGCSGRRVPG
jgi:hypothetical protein